MFDESFKEAWVQRFGEEPSFDFPELARLCAHRSIRDYSDREISEETIKALIGSAQSAATSSNLNLWSIVTIQDAERRKEIARLCDNQEHIVKAPWFLVFLADIYRLKKAVQQVGEAGEGLDYAEFALMAVIDAALAAEHLVCAAEKLGIGICYIGATRNQPDDIQNLLNLPFGTFAAFGLCLGYPSEDCQAQIKPRPSQESIWFKEVYDHEVSCEEYDQRMEPFYVSQGMKGSVTWSMRSGRRVDGKHMTGREVLKSYLEKQGLYRR